MKTADKTKFQKISKFFFCFLFFIFKSSHRLIILDFLGVLQRKKKKKKEMKKKKKKKKTVKIYRKYSCNTHKEYYGGIITVT